MLQTISWHPLSNTPPPSKLKALARDGIPLSLRPALWYQLSGAAALKHTEPAEYYTSLASPGKLSDQDGPELSLDLFRTFSTHPLVSSYKALETVRRIVTAFGRRNQSVSYSQNVNFVVAFLLVVMGLAKEEEVFWVLTALLERRLPATSVVEVSMSMVHCSVILTCKSLLPVSCQDVVQNIWHDNIWRDKECRAHQSNMLVMLAASFSPYSGFWLTSSICCAGVIWVECRAAHV